MGSIFYQVAFPSFEQIAFNHAIPFLEDRSDAACRIVYVRVVGVLSWYARGRRWAGESSRCEDPAPTVGIAGRVLRRMRRRPSFTPKGHQWEQREGRITTRHAASLRTSRTGRIGFKPPYSKGRPLQKSCMGAIFYRGGPFFCANSFQLCNPISRST